MTILTWKEILIRILQGIAELPDLPQSSRKELEHLVSNLKSGKISDIQACKKEVTQNKKIMNSLKGKVQPSIIKKRLCKLDDLLKELADKKDEAFEQRDEKLFPIFLSDFDVGCLESVAYNLRLGDEVYVTTGTLPKKLTSIDNTVTIKPGEFGVLLTHEYMYVPQDLLGLISLRFSYKKLGLVNISGFHVDPGFRGRLVFTVYNTGPNNIVLRYKEPVFMIMFDELIKPIKEAYTGRFAYLEQIPVDIVTSLSGPSVSVLSLDKKIRSLEIQVRIIQGLIVGLIGSILAVLFKILLGP